MAEGYEEGTYLSEFTEAGHKAVVLGEATSEEAVPTGLGNTRALAVGAGVSVSMILVLAVVVMFGALISFVLPPFSCCIGPLLMIGAAYLIGSVGGAVAQVAGGDAPASSTRLPGNLWGECPYCSHPRGAKRKEGERLACGSCLNIFVIRGDRFYIPEERLKRFRKKIPAPTVKADPHLPPTSNM